MQNIKYYTDLIGNEIKTAFIENKFLLLFSTLLFVIPMFIGYFFAPYIAGALNPMVDSFRDRVQQGEIKITPDSIFFNNVYVAIIMYFGSILFGIITVSALVTNGVFIGYFATQMPLGAFLLYTLPHGIFEIPAIIIAGCGGFVLLKFIFNFVYNVINYKDIPKTDEFDNLNNLAIKDKIVLALNFNISKLTQSLALFALSVVLLIIAAFIEAYLTIPIASLFISF